MPPPVREPWPTWTYYPTNEHSPDWVDQILIAAKSVEATISSASDDFDLDSNSVLAALSEGLRALGFDVESGKAADGKVRRPVLFGENGVPTVVYEIDAAHDDLGIVVEVEAGRGARGNAAYRDLIRTSLILDARFLVLYMPVVYRVAKRGGGVTRVPAYRDCRDMLSAIYASRRLLLPFEGILLIGY